MSPRKHFAAGWLASFLTGAAVDIEHSFGYGLPWLVFMGLSLTAVYWSVRQWDV